MKLSIIIPIYNCKDKVLRIIDSILASKSSDFEIICVNDGSTDNTLDFLNKIKDFRVGVFSKQNEGTFKTWQYGLSLARGEFVTIFDQDDYIDTDYIDFIISFIDEGTADLLFTPYYIERNNGSKYYDKLCFEDGLYHGDSLQKIMPILTGGRVPYAKFSKVIRTEVLQSQVKNTYLGKIHDFEDWLTMIEVFSRIKSIYIYNRPFYHYIQNDDSVSKSSKSYRNNLESLQNMINYLEKSEYSDLDDETICSIYFYGLKVVLNKCIKIKEFDLAKEIVGSKQFTSFLQKSNIGFAEKIILGLRLVRIYHFLFKVRSLVVKR